MSLQDMGAAERQAWEELEEAEVALEAARQNFIAVTNEHGGARRRRPELRVIEGGGGESVQQSA